METTIKILVGYKLILMKMISLSIMQQ